MLTIIDIYIYIMDDIEYLRMTQKYHHHPEPIQQSVLSVA